MKCILRPEFCNTSAYIELFDRELDEDGAPVPVFEGSIKGHFQRSIKQVLNNNTRTQAVVGIFLTPADSIPESLDFSGGNLNINGKDYFITDVVANYDIESKLNYWTVKTE